MTSAGILNVHFVVCPFVFVFSVVGKAKLGSCDVLNPKIVATPHVTYCLAKSYKMDAKYVFIVYIPFAVLALKLFLYDKNVRQRHESCMWEYLVKTMSCRERNVTQVYRYITVTVLHPVSIYGLKVLLIDSKSRDGQINRTHR